MSEQQAGPTSDAEVPTLGPQDDDDELMVYRTPNDYASSATKEKQVLLAQGTEAILESEIRDYIPRLEHESDADYVKRYIDGMNDMVRRGVHILNDQTTHDVSPDMFFIDGREFDVGPSSGVTKGEYRDFSNWIGGGEVKYADVPERFKKFEVPTGTAATFSGVMEQAQAAPLSLQ